MHIVPLLGHSASNNGVTLKSGVRVVQLAKYVAVR